MHKGLWYAAFLGTGLLAGSAALHAMSPHDDQGQAPPAVCPLGGQGHKLCGGVIAIMHEALFGMDLSDAQREAIHKTLKARHTDIAAAVKPVIVAKRALHDAVLTDDPDDAAIRAAAAALGKSIGDAAVTFAKIKVELVENAQLTSEQKQKFADFKADYDASIDAFLHERHPGLLHGHVHE